MAAQARKDLRPPVIDLSDALNGVKAPVMIDYEHTNELGALRGRHSHIPVSQARTD